MPDRIETITNLTQLPKSFTDMLCASSLQTLMIMAQRRGVDVGVVWHLENDSISLWYARDTRCGL